MKKKIRLGTRGSPLALIQAESIRQRLFEMNPHLSDEATIEIIPIRTSGDWRPEQKDKRFVEMGGNKGLFTKELEVALSEGQADIAVHSLKDLPTELPGGLKLGAVGKSADVRDVLRDLRSDRDGGRAGLLLQHQGHFTNDRADVHALAGRAQKQRDLPGRSRNGNMAITDAVCKTITARASHACRSGHNVDFAAGIGLRAQISLEVRPRSLIVRRRLRNHVRHQVSFLIDR